MIKVLCVKNVNKNNYRSEKKKCFRGQPQVLQPYSKFLPLLCKSPSVLDCAQPLVFLISQSSACARCAGRPAKPRLMSERHPELKRFNSGWRPRSSRLRRLALAERARSRLTNEKNERLLAV